MPSWNIHIAHAERLLEGGGPLGCAVRDRNAFLFGNLVPDIYVGYMVPAIAQPIPYRITHFAAPEHIPKPREREFWDSYVAPLLREVHAPGASLLGDGLPVRDLSATSELPLADVPASAADATAVGIPAGTAIASAASGNPDDAVIGNSPARAADHDARAIGAEPPNHLADLATGRPMVEPLSIAAEVAHVAPAHAPTFLDEVDARVAARMQEAAFDAGWRPATEREARAALFDLTLGVWVHLLADTTWNTRVSEVLAARGETPSRGFRIKKQADFDLFGKSLAIDMVPLATPALIETAARFAQYPIDERSVYATTAIAHEIVRTNHAQGAPVYQLLDEGFFDATFTEVIERADALFAQRVPSRAFPSR